MHSALEHLCPTSGGGGAGGKVVVKETCAGEESRIHGCILAGGGEGS